MSLLITVPLDCVKSTCGMTLTMVAQGQSHLMTSSKNSSQFVSSKIKKDNKVSGKFKKWTVKSGPYCFRMVNQDN